MLRNLFFLILTIPVYTAKAQDSLLIHNLLHRIASQQVPVNASIAKGNFLSYISNKPSFATKQSDDNIFFSALISYTLGQQGSLLSKNNCLLANSIRHQTNDLYPHFQNKNGRVSFNFWRTDTAFRFPYTTWIRKLKKHTSLPDDMDDTVLSLMAQEADSITAAIAHNTMQLFINKKNNRSKTIEKKYRSYGAYSVWYGKKFPPVFDVCVLCNILSFVECYNLTWTAADSASLQVVIQCIKSSDYITKPLNISPYYGNTSLILYHLARLMKYKEIPELEAMKTELIVAAAKRLQRADDVLEKVILSSTILKWGYVPPDVSFPVGKDVIKKIEASNLPFFTGNVPSYFPSFYRHLFSQKKWLLFYHYCPAFNDALLLEYLLLKQTATNKTAAIAG